jgi:hypothetical protein
MNPLTQKDSQTGEQPVMNIFSPFHGMVNVFL